jgi:hypothetical protein
MSPIITIQIIHGSGKDIKKPLHALTMLWITWLIKPLNNAVSVNLDGYALNPAGKNSEARNCFTRAIDTQSILICESRELYI